MRKSFNIDIKFILKDKYQNKLNNKNIVSFLNDLKLLKNGYPRDYIIGNVDFLNLKIDLSCHPLIPRVETEYWVEKTIPLIKKHFKNNKKIKTLDIFSGSGCIAMAISKNIKKTIIDFSDIDKNNLRQIKINLKQNKIKNYRKLIISDIFSKINDKYDLILANPPYVPVSEAIKAPFEPLKAIKAGKDGLSVIRPFLRQIEGFLNNNSMFIMEFHPGQQKEIKTTLIKHGFKNFKISKDQYRRYRYVVVFK